MTKNLHIHPTLPAQLGISADQAFDFFWNQDAPWVEPLNERRGGWSGVYRLDPAPDRERPALYVKKQHAHYTGSFLGIGRRLTLQREFRLLLHAKHHAVRAPELVYFGIRGEDAVLVTRELTGFRPLAEFETQSGSSVLSPTQRAAIAADAGILFRRLHRAGMRHGAPHAHHLMVNLNSGGAALLDWEMGANFYRPMYNWLRDLGELGRSAAWIDPRDRLIFFRAYFGTRKLSPVQRWKLTLIEKRILRKQRRSEARARARQLRGE